MVKDMRFLLGSLLCLKSIRIQTVILNTDSCMTEKQIANTNIELPICLATWSQYSLKKIHVVEIKL